MSNLQMDPTASQQAAEAEQPEAADSGENETPTGEAIVSSSDPELVERQSSEIKESNVPKESASQSDCSSTHEQTNPDASEAQQDNGEPCLIESSPEKSSPEKFKEDELKSPPELEVFSIEEEEVDEEDEEAEAEEEEVAGGEAAVGAVEDYLEMDEDEEMFFESTDRVGANESIDNDLSTDEYTDDEKRSAIKRDSKRRKSSEEDEDDDDDVQVLTDDDDDEVEEEEEYGDDDEELEEEDYGEEEEMFHERRSSPGRSGSGSDSDSDGFVVERKLKKRYDDYPSKLVATIRKRAIKVLHKRKRMHVMEESGSSERFLMCADGALFISTPTLKPALGALKAGCKPESPQQQRPPPAESSGKTTRDSGASPTTTDDSHQNKAKDTEQKKEADQRRPQVIEKRSESDQFTISSTIDDAVATGDNMPTATAALEDVPERIADSSDDGISTLSSKKAITAATTPTVNSSASTAGPPPPETGGQPEKKESSGDGKEASDGSDASPSPKETVPSETESKGKAAVVGNAASEREPSVVAESQPTADDVMKGIDDFMDHNGSSGDGEEKEDFNDDLTFQMDVDEGSAEKPKSDEKSDNSAAAVVQESRALANAIDLTSSSGGQSKEESPPKSVDAKEAASEVADQPCFVIGSVVSLAAKDQPLTEPSPPPPPSTGENAKDATSTVVTSTPVAASVRQKRDGDAEVQVKSEDEEAAGTDEVQNLSKAKPLARSSTISDEVQQPPAKGSARPAEPANRKRRRSVNDEEEDAARAATESDDPIEPAKKLKLEVDSHFRAHERVVKEYIDTTPNTSVDEIQSTTDVLVKEIQSLNDEIRDTERKWNELLHLKKVKEEILLRLNRRKHVLSITETRLGEVSAYNHVDSSNFSNQHEQQQQQNHHQQHQGQRSSSVGPRLPTPPPEVEIRPASVTITPTNYSATTNGGTFADKPGTGYSGNKLISNRRSSSSSGCGGSGQQYNNSSGNSRHANAKDTDRFVSQFNNSNNAVTMVPLHNSTTSMILNARANMNKAEIARDKSMAEQIQRHILPKPVLSNHQQILNNLAISAGLTASGGNATALQNGHHSSTSSSAAASAAAQLHHQQQLQIGRQGMRKDVSSIIADYRQKHPENVPRRGRRLKNVPSSSGNNNGGNSIAASFGDGGAISLTALSGGKSPGSVRSNSVSADVANRISELMAAAETSRPSSNDSSQSGSNLLSSLVSAGAGGSGTNTTTGQQFLKEVLAQFAKMSQNEQCLLSNLQLLTNNLSASGANTVSSPQQSPQNLQQQQHSSQQPHHHHQQQQQHLQSGGTKTSLPEVTLHPVMNSTAHSDTVLGSPHNSSLAGVNLSAVANTSTNSLLHGILTKSAARPAGTAAAAVGAAVAANFNSFSPTLARLLTAPERMGSQAQTSSTVTSGALASLHHPGGSVVSGLNLSKNNNEISITPVLGPNMQQTLLAQQQQQLADQQKQLQRLRDHHLFKGEPYLNLDDEADDSADRLVIDEGDDMMMGRGDSRRRGAEINENEVPQCQGCKRMEAKFVCAGCSNQWYCSRACQVKAWDDHSEVCCCD